MLQLTPRWAPIVAPRWAPFVTTHPTMSPNCGDVEQAAAFVANFIPPHVWSHLIQPASARPTLGANSNVEYLLLKLAPRSAPFAQTCLTLMTLFLVKKKLYCPHPLNSPHPVSPHVKNRITRGLSARKYGSYWMSDRHRKWEYTSSVLIVMSRYGPFHFG